MRFVIDASVAIKWFVPEPDSDKANQILQAFRADHVSLLAPDVVLPEVGNTLWKRCLLTREIPVASAAQSYEDFMGLALELHAAQSIAAAAFGIAIAARHPLYDSFYLALAQKEHCEFLTADQALIRKLSGRFPFIRPLGTL